MYGQDDIDDAVAAGALAPEQAASLRAHVEWRNRTPTVDEEYNRVLRGYNDIFAASACLFALLAVGWLGAKIPLGARGPGFNAPVIPVMAAVFVAAASWGLAELFVRRRRTALPAYLLAFTFGLAVLAAPLMLVAPNVAGAGGSLVVAVAATVAGLASWGFWLRFRAAFAPTMAVALVILGIAVLVGALFGGAAAGIDVVNFVLLLAGIATFAFALWWDFGDPWRISGRNEVGLWLHWLASLLVVYPAGHLLGVSRGGPGSVVMGILLFVVLVLVAVTVNRKVIVAGATAPLMTALAVMVTGSAHSPLSPYQRVGVMPGGLPGGSADGLFLTVMIVGAILLGLALGWSALRAGLVAALPGRWQQLMPADPPALASVPEAAPEPTPPHV